MFNSYQHLCSNTQQYKETNTGLHILPITDPHTEMGWSFSIISSILLLQVPPRKQFNFKSMILMSVCKGVGVSFLTYVVQGILTKTKADIGFRECINEFNKTNKNRQSLNPYYFKTQICKVVKFNKDTKCKYPTTKHMSLCSFRVEGKAQ